MVPAWQVLAAVVIGVLAAGATYSLCVRARAAVERFAVWRDDALAHLDTED